MNLNDANIEGANLSGANLKLAYLRGTDLSGANLTGANLSGDEGISNEVFDQQAASLKRATMPTGQKYEDWLKSKGREEDGQNDGSS